MESLRAAAGQQFLFNFSGYDLTPELVEFVKETRPGGVILFGRNIASGGQVRALVQSLQGLAARIHLAPLIVGVDDEGGRVTRLSPDLYPLVAPSQMAQAAAGGPEAARICALTTAGHLRRLGFTLNFAPVADVNNNPANPIIGARSFGEDPALVGDCVAAAVEGYLAG